MKRTNLRESWILRGLLTLCVVVWSVPASRAQQPSTADVQSFEWSAELVSLDPAGPSVTLNARVRHDQAAAEFERLKAGERVLLTWSGIDKYSDGIRNVMRYDPTRKTTARFTFPAEFLAFDASHRIATIKVLIPSADVSRIQSLKPGQWVSATSPHGKDADTRPVSAIRPYGASSNART